MKTIENSAGLLSVPHNIYISSLIFDWYSRYNKEIPVDQLGVYELRDVSILIHQKIHVPYKPTTTKSLRSILVPTIDSTDKKVVLGFSGGLDSVYQAINLKERGYDVILYHLKGINTYENGQATKRCKGIADKLGMTYVESTIHKKQKHQQVPENPLKNELIMGMMIDYCLQENIHYISLGDDLNLSLNDAMVGVNVTDSREITQAFIKGIQSVINIDFLPIIGGEKVDRLKKLIEYGLEDDYYSCVQAGRFNKKLHNLNEKKFGVKLFDGNCGCSCRKCAMHNLLLHYSGLKVFPEKFIDKCWEVMWRNSHSADFYLFSPKLPLEQRIKHLFKY